LTTTGRFLNSPGVAFDLRGDALKLGHYPSFPRHDILGETE
jgi:hypothetical protein